MRLSLIAVKSLQPQSLAAEGRHDGSGDVVFVTCGVANCMELTIASDCPLCIPHSVALSLLHGRLHQNCQNLTEPPRVALELQNIS